MAFLTVLRLWRSWINNRVAYHNSVRRNQAAALVRVGYGLKLQVNAGLGIMPSRILAIPPSISFVIVQAL
jgi:hypothetical protein